MRAAIVGCGTIADVHGKSILQMPGAELVGCADIKSERAEDFAKRYGTVPYESWEEMIRAEKPDVVHICTPHYLHTPMAVAALEAGIHVFMEKPPVIDRAQLDELKQGVSRGSARLGICYQNRYNHCVKKALELIRSGEAGAIKGARGIVTWHRDEAYYEAGPWRGSLGEGGGGALINQSIHTLDLLQYFLGKPVMTEATMANHHLKGVIEVEDTMEAFVRFEQADAVFYATNAYSSNVPPLIEIECEKVRVRIEDPEVTFYYRDGRVEKPQAENIPALGKGYWGSSHASCIRDFYDCVETGRHFGQELSDMEDSIRLTLAVYESARTGKMVYL